MGQDASAGPNLNGFLLLPCRADRQAFRHSEGLALPSRYCQSLRFLSTSTCRSAISITVVIIWAHARDKTAVFPSSSREPDLDANRLSVNRTPPSSLVGICPISRAIAERLLWSRPRARGLRIVRRPRPIRGCRKSHTRWRPFHAAGCRPVAGGVIERMTAGAPRSLRLRRLEPGVSPTSIQMMSRRSHRRTAPMRPPLIVVSPGPQPTRSA